MMLLMHDLEEREVTFTSYEYDDDFNATEVEKTEMQDIPVFTAMLGSKNKEIMTRLFELGVKHGVVEKHGLFYGVSSKLSGGPFDVFMTMQDDIVFVTNSPEKIGKYSLKKGAKNLGSHKDVLQKNIFSVYMSNEKAYSALTKFMPEMGVYGEEISRNFPEMFITMPQMKGNIAEYNMTIKSDGKSKNSLKLLMETVTNTMDAMKEVKSNKM